MKRFLILLTIPLLLSNCKKDSSVTVIKTGRVELASVCAQTTFMVDDSGFLGKRIGIYRSGRCEFTAYIEMEEISWNADSVEGILFIKCPPIKVGTPKYHFGELTTIYKESARWRDLISQKEKHDDEKKMVKQLQDSLSQSKDFRSKLISKARQSAEILLPKLLKFDGSLVPNVQFKD